MIQNPVAELNDECYSKRNEVSGRSGTRQIFEIKQPNFFLSSCSYHVASKISFSVEFEQPTVFVCLGEPITIEAGKHGFIALQKNEVCMLQTPNIVCNISFQKSKRYQFLAISLTATLIRNASPYPVTRQHWEGAIENNSLVLKPAQALTEEMKEVLPQILATPLGEESKSSLYFHISQLVRMILRLYYFEEKETELPQRAGALEAEKYLAENACSTEKISHLIANAGLTDHIIIKKFKDITGESPTGFILNKRVQKAKELLLTTDMSISKICTATGFNFQQMFNDTFKTAIGKSPAAYRKQGLQKQDDTQEHLPK